MSRPTIAELEKILDQEEEVEIEILPNGEVRAKGQSLGSFTHWIMNAMISGLFPLMAASSGGYPFVFFSLMMVVQFFVVLFVYPETKGVTLEDMQKKLAISQAH